MIGRGLRFRIPLRKGRPRGLTLIAS